MGTAVSKRYQTIDAAARALAMPERVSVAMNEIAAEVREGLLALAVGAGLQVMQAMFSEDVSVLCGPKGRHDPDPKGLSARYRGRVGDPGRSAGAGDPAAGAGQRRRRGTARGQL